MTDEELDIAVKWEIDQASKERAEIWKKESRDEE